MNPLIHILICLLALWWIGGFATFLLEVMPVIDSLTRRRVVFYVLCGGPFVWILGVIGAVGFYLIMRTFDGLDWIAKRQIWRRFNAWLDEKPNPLDTGPRAQ